MQPRARCGVRDRPALMVGLVGLVQGIRVNLDDPPKERVEPPDLLEVKQGELAGGESAMMERELKAVDSGLLDGEGGHVNRVEQE